MPDLSATPLSDAIAKAAKEQTDDGLAAGVVLADGQATAELRAKKSWASGWSVSGAVSYAKAAGYAAAAFVGWKPKDPTP